MGKHLKLSVKQVLCTVALMMVVFAMQKVNANAAGYAQFSYTGNEALFEDWGNYKVYKNTTSGCDYFYTDKTVSEQLSTGGFVGYEADDNVLDSKVILVCEDSEPIALRQNYENGYFKNCSALEYIDLSRFDLSGVTTFESMFHGCSSLKSIDTNCFSNVKPTSCANMFNGCESLESIDITKMDFSNCSTIYLMLAGTNNLTGIIDCANSNIYLVPNWERAFQGCNSNKSGDLVFNFENMDGSHIENFSSVFTNAYGEYKGSGFCPSNATKISSCFWGFDSPSEELIINDWELHNASSVDSFLAYLKCDSVQMNNWTLDNVVTIGNAINADGLLDTRNYIMKNWNCPKLESITSGLLYKANDSYADFTGWTCPKLTNFVGLSSSSSCYNSTFIFDDWVCDSLTSMDRSFYHITSDSYCKEGTVVHLSLKNFKAPVEKFSSSYYNGSYTGGLTSPSAFGYIYNLVIDLRGFDFSHVKSFDGMFTLNYSKDNLENIIWDDVVYAPNLESMTWMFAGWYYRTAPIPFPNIDIGDSDNLVKIDYLYYCNYEQTEFDFSRLPKNVDYGRSIFYDTKLESADMSMLNIPKGLSFGLCQRVNKIIFPKGYNKEKYVNTQDSSTDRLLTGCYDIWLTQEEVDNNFITEQVWRDWSSLNYNTSSEYFMYYNARQAFTYHEKMNYEGAYYRCNPYGLDIYNSLNADVVDLCIPYGLEYELYDVSYLSPHHELDCWYIGTDNTGEKMPAGSIRETYDKTAGVNYSSLYAQMKLKNYMVAFNTQGGTEVPSEQHEALSYINLDDYLDKTTKKGHTFKNWSYKDSQTGEYIEATGSNAMQQMTGDITYYANWTVNNYEVTFNSNNGTEPIKQTVAYSSKIVEPQVPTRAHCDFAGWYKDYELTEKWDFDTDVVEEDTILYAKWVPTKYKITFDSNGGSKIQAQYLSYGSKITEPKAPDKKKALFLKWCSDKELKDEWDFDNDTVKGELTLYAKYETLCEVSFDSDGGTSVKSQYLQKYEKATRPENPSKEGHIFKGWFTDKDSYLFEFEFETTSVTKDIVLYAKWEAAPVSIVQNPDSNTNRYFNTEATVEGQKHIISGNKQVTITDQVSYNGYGINGRKYVMAGTLINKKTGEEYVDAKGQKVTGKTEYTQQGNGGEIKVSFTFDSSNLQPGDELVVFERMYDENGYMVASHLDINDAKQTVSAKGYVKVQTGVYGILSQLLEKLHIY